MPLPSIALGGAVLQWIVDFTLSFPLPLQSLAADAACANYYFLPLISCCFFIADWLLLFCCWMLVAYMLPVTYCFFAYMLPVAYCFFCCWLLVVFPCFLVVHSLRSQTDTAKLQLAIKLHYWLIVNFLKFYSCSHCHLTDMMHYCLCFLVIVAFLPLIDFYFSAIINHYFFVANWLLLFLPVDCCFYATG